MDNFNLSKDEFQARFYVDPDTITSGSFIVEDQQKYVITHSATGFVTLAKITVDDLVVDQSEQKAEECFEVEKVLYCKGMRGPTGPRGSKGAPGQPGPPGPQGERGANGADSFVVGPVGVSGDAGFQGDTNKGEKGDVGVIGLKGPDGERGAAANGPSGNAGINFLKDIMVVFQNGSQSDFFNTANTRTLPLGNKFFSSLDSSWVFENASSTNGAITFPADTAESVFRSPNAGIYLVSYSFSDTYSPLLITLSSSKSFGMYKGNTYLVQDIMSLHTPHNISRTFILNHVANTPYHFRYGLRFAGITVSSFNLRIARLA